MPEFHVLVTLADGVNAVVPTEPTTYVEARKLAQRWTSKPDVARVQLVTREEVGEPDDDARIDMSWESSYSHPREALYVVGV